MLWFKHNLETHRSGVFLGGAHELAWRVDSVSGV